MLLAFHKPFGVLSQFSADGSAHRTLEQYGFPKKVYPIGRLDAVSEGLLLLSDERALNARLLDPKRGHVREYWAQVEGVPTQETLDELMHGLIIRGRKTLPCRAWLLNPQPRVPPRDPPIRLRKKVADVWMALALVEGRNHQVRRMTAAIGHPTLRLIRMRIGEFVLGNLPPGKWRQLGDEERLDLFR